MPDWLNNLITDPSVIGLMKKISFTAILVYFVKKVADLTIDWWRRKRQEKKKQIEGRFLVSFEEFYGDEIERHGQEYVQ